MVSLHSHSPSLLVVCIGRHQKHDHANYDQFSPNFDITCKIIQRISVPNLNSFQINKNRVMVKEIEEFLKILKMKKTNRGLVGILLLTNMAAAI